MLSLIPLNEHFLALKNKFNNEQKELKTKLIATEGLHQGTKRSRKVEEEIEFLKDELSDLQAEIDAPPAAGGCKPLQAGMCKAGARNPR